MQTRKNLGQKKPAKNIQSSKSKAKKKKANSKRYTAMEINGKGYIFDCNFSSTLPIAVERNYEIAVKQVNKFNKEED